MNVACVIGNGPSRLQLDLGEIQHVMTTYGCNALYRDFIPDYLIAMDLNMVLEILGNNIHYKTKFYTQHTNKIDDMARDGHPINFVWGQRETLDSGNTALRIALKNNHDIVYMIGFDYSENPSSLPNVYQGTTNYVNGRTFPAATMQDTRWKQRLNKSCKEFPNTKIVRILGNKPKLEVSHNNFIQITTEQFKEELYGIYA